MCAGAAIGVPQLPPAGRSWKETVVRLVSVAVAERVWLERMAVAAVSSPGALAAGAVLSIRRVVEAEASVFPAASMATERKLYVPSARVAVSSGRLAPEATVPS